MAEKIIENKEQIAITEEAEQNAEESEQTTKEQLGTFSIILKKPVKHLEKTYTELEFDFDSLTGEDALNIENELAALGRTVIMPAFSGEYLIRMAAKACTSPIGSDIFKKMSLSDYEKIRNKAKNFLLQAE